MPEKQIHNGLNQAIDNINVPEIKINTNITASHKKETSSDMSSATGGETTTPITTSQATQHNDTTPSAVKVKKEAKKHSQKAQHHKPRKKGKNNDHHHKHARETKNDAEEKESIETVRKLDRLRRDLFVANELEALLNKLNKDTVNKAEYNNRVKREEELGGKRGDSAVPVNFYKLQNSQYLEQLSADNEGLKFRSKSEKERDDKDKRFLFKKTRKKKKTKNIWKNLFGVHTDNRFLNQNFPNSQYAIYPN